MKQQKFYRERASKEAEKTSKETFISGGSGSGLPEIKIQLNKINLGMNIIDLLSNNKILNSKSEARRVILNKGIKINNQTVSDEKKMLNLDDFVSGVLKLSYGKKKLFN